MSVLRADPTCLASPARSRDPLPIDRPPFPLPSGVEVPVYFTIQPGGAYVYTRAYGQARRGAWLVYPNYGGKPAGEPANFWHYDPEERGWYVYGMGSVTPDGRQVVPHTSVALYEFTGPMINFGPTPGPPGGNGPPDGDPVDLGTGQFVMTNTSLQVHSAAKVAHTVARERTSDGHYFVVTDE